MKKIVCLFAALLVCILIVPACSSSSAKDKIVIGMSRSLSGPLAQIGDSAFKVIYDTIVPEWNAEGGLNVGGKKMPVELKIYDDKSDAGILTKNLEKLILEDKVDFIMPPVGTAMVFAAAPICNKYNKVLLTAEGGATQLKDALPGMPYVFINLSFSDWYEMPILGELLASKGVKTAYVIYIEDLHGIEYSGVAGVELPKHGIEIVKAKSVPPDVKDLSVILKDAQATNADAFLAFAYPDQVMLATGQAMSLGYNPKAFLGGPGVNFGFFHTAFKDAVEGVMGWGTWNAKMSPEMQTLADKLYKGKPEELHDWWGHVLYWAGMEVFKQAVEKAGTLDNVKIRDVIATSHFQTILGDTFYTNQLLAKESHPGEVGQWQNGVFEIIGGNHPTASFIYPKPPWPKQ
ncbi:MAG: amino acid ABC transporter substrate-binding protein [Dehalococcoidales bacterium]|nr:amino acid ABC transporter substrate-binding protein [Dehalococcoidales bacterium]